MYSEVHYDIPRQCCYIEYWSKLYKVDGRYPYTLLVPTSLLRGQLPVLVHNKKLLKTSLL